MKKLLFLLVFFTTIQIYSQQEIFVARSAGLYSRSITGCNFTFIGQTKIGTIQKVLWDLALTPDGNLWGVAEQTIYNVNKQTGVLALGVSLPHVPTGLEALDNNNLVYEENSRLYKVNLGNGVVTDLGDLFQLQSPGDLTYYEGSIYIAGYDRMMKVDLNDDMSSITNIEFLPYVPGAPDYIGLIAISSPYYSSNILMGFTNYQTYEICPIDQSYTLLCTLSVPNQNFILGAAATRLPLQNPLPVNCPTLGNDGFERADNGIWISPNPVNTSQSIQIRLNSSVAMPYDLQISDMRGKILFLQAAIQNNENSIDVDFMKLNITPGIYMVEVQTSDSKYISKIIVK